jgi:hypothetical protein
MLVLCPECKNHYEDSNQSPECAGIGVKVTSPTTPGSAHPFYRQYTAAEENVHNVRGARVMRRETARSNAAAGRTPLAAVPTADAGPSDG